MTNHFICNRMQFQDNPTYIVYHQETWISWALRYWAFHLSLFKPGQQIQCSDLWNPCICQSLWNILDTIQLKIVRATRICHQFCLYVFQNRGNSDLLGQVKTFCSYKNTSLSSNSNFRVNYYQDNTNNNSQNPDCHFQNV